MSKKQTSFSNARKWCIFSSLCAGYVLYTMTRRLVTIATPNIVTEQYLTKTQIGLLSSYFSLGYGGSRLVSAVLSDFVSCRALFCGGLAAASLAIIAFGIVDDFVVLSICWCLCGVCQGVGWPALSRLLLDLFADNDGNSEEAPLGLLWSLASVSGNVGSIAAPLAFVPLFAFGWKMSFLVSGAVGVALSIGLWAVLPSRRSLTKRNSSTSAPAIIKYDWAISARFICLNITNILAYFVSKCLSDWSALYLLECLQLPAPTASMLTMIGEIGGAVGTIGSGLISDALGGASDAAGLALSLLSVPAALLLFFSDALNCLSNSITSYMLIIMMVFLFIFSASASGPKNLVGLSVRDVVPASAVGTASGVVGLTSQLGSAMAGVFAARILEIYGWSSFLPMLFGGSLLLSICLFIGWRLALSSSRVDNVDKSKIE